MTRAIACAAVGVALAAGTARAAGSAMLGGFQPVAVEDGARAAWICPAGIAYAGSSQLAIEGVFREEADGGFGELSALTFGAATAGRAFGWQLEMDDVPGVPDWTLVVARTAGRRRGVRLGTAVEWRGGEKNRFDAIVSAFAPMGRTLRAAAVVEDLFRAAVDGEPGRRALRAGVAARGRAGWLSWDWRGREEARGRHFFGAGLDTRRLRLSGAIDDDGGWAAEARLVLGERTAGGGVVEPDEDPGSRFATVEFGSQVRRTR